MVKAEWRAWVTDLQGARGVLVLAFLLGLALAAGQAPLSLSLVAFFALIGLFALFDRARNSRHAAAVGWVGGGAYFLGGLFWIADPFFVEPLRHGWLAPFALIGLPGGLALFWALAFGIAARIGRGWRRIFLAAVLLAAVEASRAFLLTGFPWALVGYLWIDAPQMQIAAVAGPHGLTLATTLAAALGAVWIDRDRRWLAAPAVALAVIVSAGFWGSNRLVAPEPTQEVAVTLRLVQPNAEQHLKWDPDRAREFLRRLMAGTASPPEGADPDLIIWPESSVPYLLNGSERLLGEIELVAGGTPVALGIMRREDELYYNSLVLIGPGGSIAQSYDKHHLVPFGEYVPFGEILGRLGIRGLATSQGGGFAAGPGPRVLDFGPAGRVLPLICYEAIFPQHLRAGTRPDWVLQLTNDAWFGKLSGPYQHLAQARLRAVEQGLPVVRSANTGVSAVIDAKGRVKAALALDQQGHLDAPLPSALPPTPYARSGDWPAFVVLLLLAFAFASPIRRKAD